MCVFVCIQEFLHIYTYCMIYLGTKVLTLRLHGWGPSRWCHPTHAAKAWLGVGLLRVSNGSFSPINV